MTKEELKKRTKEFALRIIKVVDSLPKTTSGFVIGKQLIKSGTSVGANYRAACRGRSDAEFLSKITIVEEEADELTAIFTATGKSMKAKLNRGGK